jgi:uncharacterized protein involved in type VI secretion and phage assembly
MSPTVAASFKGLENCVYKVGTDYPVRPCTVQYRESDWDFVNRLMERRDLYYFVMRTERQVVIGHPGTTRTRPAKRIRLLSGELTN